MIIYANDYEDELPRAGGRNSIWNSRLGGGPLGWMADNRFAAYGLSADGSRGMATITSSFYLLVKYAEVSPKTFICPGDSGTTEFKLSEYGAGDREIIDLWDFGPEPPRHCSYSYHMPYGLYALTTSSEPGMAVAADRNPWMASPDAEGKKRTLFYSFNPEGSKDWVKIGNAITHQEEGQNVLFLDGHVSFEENPLCGINDDNIYTWDDLSGDPRRGGYPIANASEPAHRTDSFLVNDLILSKKTKNLTHAELAGNVDLNVKAEDLKHTIVTPHPYTKIEQGRNILWCNTFQLAWNELCELAGGPIMMESTPSMVEILNKKTATKDDLDETSYIAIAGLTEEGIIEKIKKELKKKFKAQASPELFNSLPKMGLAAIAYAYMFKALPFEYAFDRFNNNLNFEGFNVDSFGIYQCMEDEIDMAGQVLIIDYHNSDDFIIELKTKAKDDMLVLAKVQPLDSLVETIRMVEERIAKSIPRKMPMYGDLLIPVLNFKILREYPELCKYPIKTSNNKINGLPIVSAAQLIRFRLDEKGAILLSDAILPVAALGGKLIFDKPFLILLKRHEAKNPYFALWVGNAELLVTTKNK
jgi:prepilin-type processing-associated H-X9-DG protein